MKNIANDGTYQLSQPGQAAAVGYLVAVGAVQHWVLGPNYTAPGRNHPRVELTFTLVDERPYSEVEVRELHRRISGSRYVYADVSTQNALPPVDDEDVAPLATALSVGDDEFVVESAKKQIDLGCFMVTQDSAAAGAICVSGGTMPVEAWRLATSDDAPAPSNGLAVRAFRPIGRTPTTLTFQWLDDGATPPSDEHRQLDEALSRTNALQLFAVCRDRSDAPAKASAAQ